MDWTDIIDVYYNNLKLSYFIFIYLVHSCIKLASFAMENTLTDTPKSISGTQCQFFVVRKKRLCRMTVRPGRQYCGEHEPDPKTGDGQDDTRIPCPNDPKHTCYISKLEKHLLICNARQTDQPPYIVHNINAPMLIEHCPRKPLSEISKETIMQVIDKVNVLYDDLIKDNISSVPEQPMHSTVMQQFAENDRTESSRRHLRQASQLLWLVEDAGLVQDHTCYVELGAGKGQLSYYACVGWCGGEGGASSSVLAVDRAAVRHKRDNAAPAAAAGRVRADLAHLSLAGVPSASAARALVGLAKHLCGVATDYALRCITQEEVLHKTRGAVLATCCHHRCERDAYVANDHLQELGITGDELNVMLGIVSWATCGDGRSRERRGQPRQEHDDDGHEASDTAAPDAPHGAGGEGRVAWAAGRAAAGRRAKALLDWGRVLYLRGRGFDARLCHYVPAAVSPENLCIVATKHS